MPLNPLKFFSAEATCMCIMPAAARSFVPEYLQGYWQSLQEIVFQRLATDSKGNDVTFIELTQALSQIYNSSSVSIGASIGDRDIGNRSVISNKVVLAKSRPQQLSNSTLTLASRPDTGIVKEMENTSFHMRKHRRMPREWRKTRGEVKLASRMGMGMSMNTGMGMGIGMDMDMNTIPNTGNRSSPSSCPSSSRQREETKVKMGGVPVTVSNRQRSSDSNGSGSDSNGSGSDSGRLKRGHFFTVFAQERDVSWTVVSRGGRSSERQSHPTDFHNISNICDTTTANDRDLLQSSNRNSPEENSELFILSDAVRNFRRNWRRVPVSLPLEIPLSTPTQLPKGVNVFSSVHIKRRRVTKHTIRTFRSLLEGA